MGLSRRSLLSIAALLSGAMPAISSALTRDIEARVAAMAPADLAARMFMFPVTGTSLSAEDTAWLRALKPGGVILVANNFGTPDEIAALVQEIHATNPDLPPLVALDQEGGVVSRIVDDPAPAAPEMGLLLPGEITDLARLRAETLARYGFDINFAPVADVGFTPDSSMSGRAFGADPAMVAEDVVAYLNGVAGTGVLHAVKHFPGHGRVTVDSHVALPTLAIDETTWWAAEAVPFQAAVDAGVPMVMLGHLLAPMWDTLPATLSPVAVRVLREEFGFAGVVVSDDLFMGALDAWEPFEILDLAVDAGVDLLLYVGLPDTPEAMVAHLAGRVERGDLPSERLRASVARLLRMQLARQA